MTDHYDDSDVDEIDCLEAIGHLYAYLDGEIDNERQIREIERHIDHCQSCFSRAQLEKAINARLPNVEKSNTPETLRKRLQGVLKKL